MRASQNGSAMIMTMIIIAALLAGAASLAAMQTKATRGAQMHRQGITSLYCAEAGLTFARAVVAQNYASWNAALSATSEPAWLAAVDHDIDDDGSPDFVLSLKDNDDENPNNPASDNDLQVFVVAKCTKFADNAVTLSELVRFNGGGNCYQSQLGGCGGNNNAN